MMRETIKKEVKFDHFLGKMTDSRSKTTNRSEMMDHRIKYD